MKTRIVIGGLLVSMLTFNVSAQQVENDDLYFKSKDREKMKAENAIASINDKIDKDYKAFKKKNFDEVTEEDVATTSVNPTDSYSARTINPEYISRSSSAQASEDEQNYYLEGYAPVNTYDSYSGGTYNNYSSNLNSNYQNSWYGSTASNNPWYIPYHNPWYTPYFIPCGPTLSPYYSSNPGWTMSLGYTWGNMYSPGLSFGMMYSWGNPYYPYNSYSPYVYSGYTPYYNNGGYSSEASKPNYGKRPSRHSAVVTPTQQSRQRVATTNNNGSPNGRTRQTTDEYYVKPFKRTSTFENTTGGYTRDRYTSPTESASPTRTRESYNSNSRESRTTYSTPSRSSSNESVTPSRSSSGGSYTPSRSSSGSSSGSRPSRGRD
jgi:hypothetical protein